MVAGGGVELAKPFDTPVNYQLWLYLTTFAMQKKFPKKVTIGSSSLTRILNCVFMFLKEIA